MLTFKDELQDFRLLMEDELDLISGGNYSDTDDTVNQPVSTPSDQATFNAWGGAVVVQEGWSIATLGGYNSTAYGGLYFQSNFIVASPWGSYVEYQGGVTVTISGGFAYFQ